MLSAGAYAYPHLRVSVSANDQNVVLSEPSAEVSATTAPSHSPWKTPAGFPTGALALDDDSHGDLFVHHVSGHYSQDRAAQPCDRGINDGRRI